MRELVDADSATLPTASTGGDAPQQSGNVFRGSHAGTPPTRRKNEGKNLGEKHLELSDRRRAFARKRRRGKRVERKTARTKHKAARARFRLEELTFGTFNVRTAAVNGVNGIDHIDTLLRPFAPKGCDVIGL